MSTTYTLPVQDILTDALELVGVIGTGQTASPDDHGVALRALQGILKELPIHGVSWPKVTVAPVALTWSSADADAIALPADYYGVPSIYYLTTAGARVDLEILTKAKYDAITEPAKTAEYPQMIYIGPDNSALLWPVPESDPSLKMTYQAIVTDATLAASPDVAQTWLLGLGLWVANEIAPKYGMGLAERRDLKERHLERRALMLAHATETAPIRISVDD